MRRPNLRLSNVIRKDMKEYRETKNNLPENVKNDNLMCRPQIGKRAKKTKCWGLRTGTRLTGSDGG